MNLVICSTLCTYPRIFPSLKDIPCVFCSCFLRISYHSLDKYVQLCIPAEFLPAKRLCKSIQPNVSYGQVRTSRSLFLSVLIEHKSFPLLDIQPLILPLGCTHSPTLRWEDHNFWTSRCAWVSVYCTSLG